MVFSLLPTKNGCFSVIIDLSNAKLLNMRQFDKFFQKQNQNAQNIHGRLTPHFAPLCTFFKLEEADTGQYDNNRVLIAKIFVG